MFFYSSWKLKKDNAAQEILMDNLQDSKTKELGETIS